MDVKALENKLHRDIDKAKDYVVTLGEDGITSLNKKFEKLTDETKVMITDAVKSLNKDVGHGLIKYNAKVQDVADRFPGNFGKKAARYPWVTITISLAAGLLLGVLLKPGRQPAG